MPLNQYRMYNPSLKKLIEDNRILFWSVRREDLGKLSREAVVEKFLNYANIREIRNLIEIIGIQAVAQVFYHQIGKKRINYNKRTINYFNLYFKRHAQGNIIT